MEGYYKRSRITRSGKSSYQQYAAGLPGNVFAAEPSLGHESTMSWRTTPSDDDVQVPSHIADPYAYFLRFDPTAWRKANALRGRTKGLDLRFDEGHTYERVQHSVIAGNDFDLKYASSQTLARLKDALIYASDGDTSLFVSNGVNVPVFPANDLAHFAQRAISKTAPSHVAFDLGRFLGELREGLPRLMLTILSLKSRTDFLRSLGSEYLNTQFGWVPLVGDLQDAISVLADTSEVLSDLPLFGNPVRRHYRLPQVTTTSVQTGRPVAFSVKRASTDPGTNLTGTLDAYAIRGTLFKRKAVEYNFAGSYTRFLPIGFNPVRYADRLSTFTSLRLTPQVLWELAPWSWLIDWALDIQSTIASNQLADDESLFIHYAYATVTAQLQSTTEFALRRTPISPTWTSAVGTASPTLVSTTYKKRIRANPYGFTVGGLDSLSGGQAAILAALGMTRLR